MKCNFEFERPDWSDIPWEGCQFEFPESELIEFDGRWWCPLHLPRLWDSGNPKKQPIGYPRFLEVLRSKISTDSRNDVAVDLSGVIFRSAGTFSSLSMADEGRKGFVFSQCEFLKLWTFSGIKFGNRIFFDNAIFHRRAQFQDCEFPLGVEFLGTLFARGATFRGVEFGYKTTFENVEFSRDADFSIVDANKRAIETYNASIFSELSFKSAHFRGRCNFSNRVFAGRTDFSGCHFEKAPWFHNCAIHQDTDFTSAIFDDTTSDDAVRAYRTLKLAMEEKRARDEEVMFFALEQKSRQTRPDTPRSIRVASRLYELASDYGRSYVRPLVILGACTILFWIIYSFVLGFIDIGALFWLGSFRSHVGAPGLWNIVRFTILQIVRPFDAFTFRGMGIDEGSAQFSVSLLLALIAAVQSVLSVTLIALSLLALRRRFKID
jgi:uncharacterized protein YjbI with pentapeptide repeats